LNIQGSSSQNTSTIAAASISCAGDSIAVAMNHTLFGKFAKSWSGVNMNAGRQLYAAAVPAGLHLGHKCSVTCTTRASSATKSGRGWFALP
jgi:hypothetical protein